MDLVWRRRNLGFTITGHGSVGAPALLGSGTHSALPAQTILPGVLRSDHDPQRAQPRPPSPAGLWPVLQPEILPQRMQELQDAPHPSTPTNILNTLLSLASSLLRLQGQARLCSQASPPACPALRPALPSADPLPLSWGLAPPASSVLPRHLQSLSRTPSHPSAFTHSGLDQPEKETFP